MGGVAMGDGPKLCGTGAGFLMALVYSAKEEGWTPSEIQEMVDAFTGKGIPDNTNPDNFLSANEAEKD